MAWQKNKILLISKETDDNGKTVVHRYAKRKSKGTGKPQAAGNKLKLRKYNPVLRKHVEYTESKFK